MQANKRLGEILVEMGALEADLLARCLTAQREDGGRLGQLLVRLHVLSETTVLEALSAQLELPVAPLDRVEIPDQVLSLLPRTAYEQHGILPFAMQGPFVHTAMVDPSQRDPLDALRQITRKVVRPYLTGPEALDRAIRRHFEDSDALVVDLTMARDASIFDRRPSKTPHFEAIPIDGPVLQHVVAEGPGGTPLEAPSESAVPMSLRDTEPPPPSPGASSGLPESFEGPDFDTPLMRTAHATELGWPLPCPSPYDAPTQLAETPFSGPAGTPPQAPTSVAAMAEQLRALAQRVVAMTAEMAELHTRVMELERLRSE